MRVPWLLVGTLAVGTLLIVILSGVVLFEIFYSVRILPGVSVWGIDLGGKTLDLATTELDTRLAANFNSAIVQLTDGEKVWAPTASELGLRFDPQATVQAAFKLGRNDPDAHFNVIFNGVNRSPVVTFDPLAARAYFNQLAAALNRDPIDAGIQLDGLKVVVTPPQSGRVLDVDAALGMLSDMARSLTLSRLVLPFEPRAPRITDASSAAAQLQKVLESNLTLQLENASPNEADSWDLTPQQLIGLIQIQHSADGTGLRLGINTDSLRAGLADLATQINRTSEDARFTFNDDTKQLEVIQPAKIGRTLDITETLQRISDAIARGDHRVALAVKVQPPDFVDTTKAADIGITQLIATGQTSYLGSSKERMTNISAATARFQGIIIKPGETFSFDNYLGDVSLDTGYAEALIIANGLTIKGVGGGVCQVSTTAFRAAFFAGFPIIERWPHAYRVGWYEPGFGPGLDATVFSPSVDFKFKNDTPYHLLIEAYANNQAGRLTFKFYSTNDGRQITVSDPIIENVVPHPPDKIEEDPTLPAGQRQQVDYAANGADVTVKRTVTRGGVLVSDDTVFTRYQPWQAIFKVGTGQ
jgi:vancomycin resistance protein YoaR